MAKDKRSSFQYRATTAEQTQKLATQTGGAYDTYLDQRFPRFKPKDQFNAVRILPVDLNTYPEATHWGMKIWVHNDIGADHGAYLCPEKMRGEPCACCDARRELEKDRRVTSEELDALKPRERTVAWIIDRYDERTGPKLWDLSWTMERNVSQLSINKRDGSVLAIDHPDEGYDIEFVKTGTGLKTKYDGVAIARQNSYISDSEKEQDTWLDFVSDNPLPSTLVWHTFEQVQKALSGRAESRDRDLDRDGGSRRRSIRDEAAEEDDRSAGRGSERRRERSRDVGEDSREETRRRSVRDDEPEERPTRSRREPEPEERSERRRRDPEPEPEERTSRRRREPEREPELPLRDDPPTTRAKVEPHRRTDPGVEHRAHSDSPAPADMQDLHQFEDEPPFDGYKERMDDLPDDLPPVNDPPPRQRRHVAPEPAAEPEQEPDAGVRSVRDRLVALGQKANGGK